MPIFQVRKRAGVSETLLESLDDERIPREFETEERKIVVVEEYSDFRNAESMLHDIKQQIATSAHAVKVPERFDELPTRVVDIPHDFLTEFPNVAWRGSIAALCRERASLHNTLPRRLAVKANAHLAVGLQQREQHAPSGRRLREVMQYADGLDAIEGAPNGCQFQNVRLRIFDIVQTKVTSAPSGVSQADPADVDRKYPRVGKNPGHPYCVLSGAATRDQNLQLGAILSSVAGLSLRPIGHELSEPVSGPSGIWAFLVLPHDLQ